MKILFLTGLLFLSISGIAQTDSSLRNNARKLVNAAERNKATDSFHIKMDSVSVFAKYNSAKILTENYFIDSKRSITIKFYFRNDSLEYITTSEKKPGSPNLDFFSRYYIQNDSLIDTEHGSIRSNVRICMAYSLEEFKKMNSYAGRMDYEFLDQYVFSLLKTLKIQIRDHRHFRALFAQK